MIPYGLSVETVAEATGIPADWIAELVTENYGITSEIARRLGRYFATTPAFWLNLQHTYDKSAWTVGQRRPRL